MKKQGVQAAGHGISGLQRERLSAGSSEAICGGP